MPQNSKTVISGRKLLAAAAALLLALAILSVLLPLRAYAETAEARTLIVTVVEEIPADEIIDDDDVPLATFDDSGKAISDQTRHVLLMSALLFCVLIYVFYFRTYEKRLSSLRLTAAEAESSWRGKRHAPGEARL